MKQVDLVAKARLGRVDPQAGLAAGSAELPALAALVVPLAGEGQLAAASGGEQQAAAIPEAGVGIAEADGVGGALDRAAGMVQIELPSGPLTAQVPLAGAAPAALEVVAVEAPLAVVAVHGIGEALCAN